MFYTFTAILLSDSVRVEALPDGVRNRSCPCVTTLPHSGLAGGPAGQCLQVRPVRERGKARVALDALKHGRRAVALQDKLVRAGYREARPSTARSAHGFRRLLPGRATVPTATRTVWRTGFGCLNGSGAAGSRYEQSWNVL
jgi:hypothetical protein